jgi:hypothetical protein
MVWVIGAGALIGVVGCAVMVYLYIKLVGKINIFLKGLDIVLNTGRGWEKRWKVCQEMFSRRTIGGRDG